MVVVVEETGKVGIDGRGRNIEVVEEGEVFFDFFGEVDVFGEAGVVVFG